MTNYRLRMTKTVCVEYEIYYLLISVKYRLAGSVKHWLISVDFFMREWTISSYGISSKIKWKVTRYSYQVYFISFCFTSALISGDIFYNILELLSTLSEKKISNIFYLTNSPKPPTLTPLTAKICCMWQNFYVDTPVTGICFNIHLTYYWFEDQISN